MFDGARAAYTSRFSEFDGLRGLLAAALVWLGANPGSTELLARKAASDILVIRYEIAAATWKAAYAVAVAAQSAAIEAYNGVLASAAAAHTRPVRTEARVLDDSGVPVFPGRTDGLPVN